MSVLIAALCFIVHGEPACDYKPSVRHQLGQAMPTNLCKQRADGLAERVRPAKGKRKFVFICAQQTSREA
jgi:hypothetical protein